MRSDSELAQIALSGKWIFAACIWIDQNAPCTVKDAVQGLIPIMPFTIRKSGASIANRSYLAREAIARYCGTRNLDFDYVINKKNRINRNGIEPSMLKEIAQNGPATAGDFDVKYAGSRLHNLLKRRNLLRMGNVYYVEGQDPTQYMPRKTKVTIEGSK